MKKFELTFVFLQLPLDFFALILAGFTAYSLRYTSFATSIRPVLFNLSWQKYWPLLLITACAWIIIFAFAGLYSTDPNRKLGRDLARVVFACSTGFAAITIYVFFTLQKFDSRFLVLAGWILAMLFVCAGRVLIRLFKMLLHRFGFGMRRVAIIGNEQIAIEIKNALNDKKYLGYKVVGLFSFFNSQTKKELLASKTNEIIFTDPKAREEETLNVIDFANEYHIIFKYSADLFATISTNFTITTIAGIPIIELRLTRLAGWNTIIKRAIDIVGSIFLMILLSPLFILTALAILIETGWPIIYKNERVGQDDKKFNIYKFRSMYQKDCTGKQFGDEGEKALQKEEKLVAKQSIKSGPIYKIKNDPRVTKAGCFIRRFSLDELPQFFNVLIGNMSLVGPRPHQPREVEKYQKRHKIILAAKPGITGLSQISGRSELSYKEEIKLDTFYMENWNWLIDLIIILKTPFVVLSKKGSL